MADDLVFGTSRREANGVHERRQILERFTDSIRIDFDSFPFDGRRVYVFIDDARAKKRRASWFIHAYTRLTNGLRARAAADDDSERSFCKRSS